MNYNEIQEIIALSFIDGIGPINAKKLIEKYNSTDIIFRKKAKELSEECNINISKANIIVSQFSNALNNAEKEIEFCTKNNVDIITYKSSSYPYRLKECIDCPIVFYNTGNIDFNKGKFLAVVGTRNASEYGKNICKQIITDLASHHNDIVIVSGLAYGIDITAHKAALENNINTIAVMANGINNIYPRFHTDVAKEITKHGSILTEFKKDIYPAKYNFVSRNRIIAGLSDATLIIESANKGGSIITADMTISYNRELFAIPGRIGDSYSEGCNNLISHQKANLVQTASDIEYLMDWKKCKIDKQNNIKQQNIQEKQINIDMSPDERIIYEIIKKENPLHKDTISLISGFGAELSSRLLTMEFKGLIKCLPGNFYTLT